MTRKSAFDVQHRFFKPLWIRLLIIAACFAWAAYEFFSLGNVFWPLLFVACGIYLAYEWLWVFDPDGTKDTEE